MLHSPTLKKAERLGVVLTEREDGRVAAHWVEHNVYAYGYGVGAAKIVFDEIAALQKIKAMNPEWRIINMAEPNENMVQLFNSDRSLVFIREGATPVDTLAALLEWQESDKPREWMVTAVPLDGGEAYRAGFMAADNPWNVEPGEGDDEEQMDWVEKADAWDVAFDAAADAAEEPEEEEPGGSVVRNEYRIRYAEAGHPNHCGDWLANLLNNLILGKTATDLQKFEDICAANGVDTSKYKRSGNGWQGRLRMTGRNLLAKRVFEAGQITIPPGISESEDGQVIQAPADWMDAQRFKGKKAEPTT
jgi:hypothetical protein